MWFFVLESGVHATVAGLLAALTIPIKPKLKPESFAPDADILLTEYKTHPIGADHLLDQGHQAVLTNLKCRIESIESPVQRLERSMHLPVGLLVIPIFALTNAAITIDLETLRDIIMSPVSMGIMFGLIMGKIIGIFGVSYIMVKSKLANLPKGVTMSQVFGVSLLGGIGFTMSIFIAELGLAGIPGALEQAKMGILFASFIAGLAGYLWLRFTR